MDLRNRGGLWKVHSKAVDIFSISEIVFRMRVAKSPEIINADSIVSDIVKWPEVKQNFKFLCELSNEYPYNGELAANLLYTLLGLFVRVHSHSYAKKVKGTFKAAKMENIKRLCEPH